MLRGSAFAGQDIGAGFREVSKRGLAAGAWEPRPLWTGAFVLIVVTTILNSAAGIMLIAAGAMVVTALVITNLRASYRVVLPEEKKAIRWLWLGFMTAAILFAAGAAPLLFMDSVAATVTALVLLTLGPAAAMICMAMAVTRAAR